MMMMMPFAVETCQSKVDQQAVYCSQWQRHDRSRGQTWRRVWRHGRQDRVSPTLLLLTYQNRTCNSIHEL